MYGEVLKFGAMIVDSLRTYKHPVFVYIPPGTFTLNLTMSSYSVRLINLTAVHFAISITELNPLL
jgi:hypothetical protein